MTKPAVVTASNPNISQSLGRADLKLVEPASNVTPPTQGAMKPVAVSVSDDVEDLWDNLPI